MTMSPKRPFYLSPPKITPLMRVAPEPFANKSHIRILEIADSRIRTPSSLIGLQTLFQLTKWYLKSASPPFHKKSFHAFELFPHAYSNLEKRHKIGQNARKKVLLMRVILVPFNKYKDFHLVSLLWYLEMTLSQALLI